MAKKKFQAEFTKWFGSLLNVLRDLGDSASHKGKGRVSFFEMSHQTGDMGIRIDYHLILRLILIFLIVISLFSCKGGNNNSHKNDTINKLAPIIDFTLIKSYPHDTTSYTEGLLIHEGKLYESTGASRVFPQTRSLFGVVDLKTGKIDPKAELDKLKYFGEGITFLNGKVFQLTYKSKTGFVYDAVTFKKTKVFTLPVKEGWGLTTDGKNLIMSDGTYVLTYLDPATLRMIKKLPVTENGIAADNLNELEYIKGFIFANIWTTNTIVKINPVTGKIVGKLNFGSLAYEAKYKYPGSLEMNGIAYDSVADRIFVTGKLWPEIYEIKLDK
jgi:glutaminyl-peptide cyclotransferase